MRNYVGALLLGALLASGIEHTARGGDPAEHRLACPTCGATGETEKCPQHHRTRVRSDLLVLHETITRLAVFETRDEHHENPFKPLVKDGSVDIAALEKLVADYKKATEEVGFDAFTGKLPLVRHRPTPEDLIANELKSIATAQAVFREGDKDRNGELDYGTLGALARTKLVDPELGSGRKRGYIFDVKPSADPEKRDWCWYGTATPETPGPGKLYYFINQYGDVWTSDKPIVVDARTCATPTGMTLRPRHLPSDD